MNHTTEYQDYPNANRKYKDTLFRMIFSRKKDLLDLYNAVNDTDYKNPDDLEIATLDNAIYMSFKNDIAFLLGCFMNLYEHQSTYNPNMPLRGLLYFARIYEKFITDRNLDIYSSSLKKIPTPRYIVFYNGTRSEPDKTILKLSDAFYQDNGCLECEVTMLNINYGKNRRLMEKCRRLEEYAQFISLVRCFLSQGNPLEHAINQAMDECIEQNILKDVLTAQRAEVLGVLLSTFNKELYEKGLKDDAFSQGLNQGFSEGLSQGLNQGLSQGRAEGAQAKLEELIHKKLAKGKSPEAIADDLEEPIEVVKNIIQKQHIKNTDITPERQP